MAEQSRTTSGPSDVLVALTHVGRSSLASQGQPSSPSNPLGVTMARGSSGAVCVGLKQSGSGGGGPQGPSSTAVQRPSSQMRATSLPVESGRQNSAPLAGSHSQP